MVERKLYCLARIDEKTGNILRQATEKDLREFGLDVSSDEGGASSSKDTSPQQQATFMQFVMNGNAWCRNCGAEASPQWRRGPVPFDVLCNACGTRYRRTQQLRDSPLTSLAMAKEVCAQEALERENAEKQGAAHLS